ncbi:39S ribosomal protein L17, mitochondrial [Diabrotica virgifera virgifera]|uniref:Large ribosomal subunit protein bL17m n=1 Tax=Diabrotica virgifera virgifera TaxID=50390 RepID=A0ABM5J0B4_DIAVI|nr:39S ribosomal protein L17, mitochondrial [Diabrotica virgifera virgifera]
MNQAEVTKLVSKLKIRVNPRLRKFRNPLGPEERLNKLRKTVTALIKHERIELNYPRANESRMYAERLISDAIRYGDCHKTTMEMADYWLTEKQLIHKLFKVLVSRYENYNIGYTRLVRVPKLNGETRERAVLELRGNPYPSLWPENNSNRDLLHNVLLDEAKKAYRMEKYKEIAAKVEENIKDSNQSIAGAEKANVDKKITEVRIENEKVESKDKENV